MHALKIGDYRALIFGLFLFMPLNVDAQGSCGGSGGGGNGPTCEWRSHGAVSPDNGNCSAPSTDTLKRRCIAHPLYEGLMEYQTCLGDPCIDPLVWDDEVKQCVADNEGCIAAICGSTQCGVFTVNEDGSSSCSIFDCPDADGSGDGGDGSGDGSSGGGGGGGDPGIGFGDGGGDSGFGDGTSGPPYVNQYGSACYSPPDSSGSCGAGQVYGTVEGQGICVTSIPSSSIPGIPQSSDQQTNPNTYPETTSTPADTSTTVTVAPGPPGPDGQPTVQTTTTTTTVTNNTTTDYDTSNTVTCSDGRLALDTISCDSNTQCSPHQMVAYGTCVELPRVAIAESDTSTTTETTVVDSSGNEIDSTTTTTTGNSSTSLTTTSGGESSQVEVEVFSGPCDPSEPDYFQCVDMPLSNLPEHSITGRTLQQVNMDFYQRINDSDLITAFNSMVDVVDVANPQCPDLSMDLTGTPINQRISSDTHCDLMQIIEPIISTVMLVIYAFLGFRIFASA